MNIDRTLRLSALTMLSSLVLAACGGGGSSAASTPAPPPPAPPPATDNATAATETATQNPMCSVAELGPFYWEVGDQSGAKVSGTVPTGGPVSATTQLSIASASKWLYSTYVVQQRGVVAADVPFLNFTSGYSGFGNGVCKPNDTVQTCLATNDSALDSATQGKFFYDSAHMEVHASQTMHLGADNDGALKAAVLDGSMGSTNFYGYSQPLLAGGVFTDAASYATFLRNILSGKLAMHDALGVDKVCTNPSTCATAVSSPINTESWNYSLGHWVEDDPVVGDHAYSSAGAFGFYPWIDKTKTYYGIIARETHTQSFEGFKSAQCGRLIRQAWVTGVPVTTATEPTPSP